ncbi:MAG: hypothetical protein V1934_02360 [Methanobacteriota archaeon]
MGKKGHPQGVNESCLVEMRESHGGLSAVFDCKGCARESDLASRVCWRGVTSAIADVSSLDSIVLAGYLETEYAGPGLEAMERLRRIGTAARRLAGRPAPSDSKACAECRLNPSRLFAECSAGFSGGVGSGQVAIGRASAAMLRGPPSPSCQSCYNSSEKDLAYLWSEYRASCREILREAYGIVEGSD